MAQATNAGQDVAATVLLAVNSAPIHVGVRTRSAMPASIIGYNAGSTPDTTSPTITVVSPTPGVAPGDAGGFPKAYVLAKVTPIVLEVSDATPGVRYFVVIARFYADAEATNPQEEVVYRRGQFRGLYVAGSKAESITNGVRLHVRRAGGWPSRSDGRMAHIVFAMDAVDEAGNLT